MVPTSEDRQAARISDPEWLDPSNPADVQGARQKLDIVYNDYLKRRWREDENKVKRASLQQFLAILGATVSIIVGAYTIYSNFFAT